MKAGSVFGFDLIILAASVSLCIIGIMFVYSSGISSDGVLQNNEYAKQIIWVAIGLAAFIGLSFFDYEKLRSFSVYIYAVMLLFLVAVLFLGDVINGARSWLTIRGVGFQPSEFMKIALVIRLAVFFENTRGKYRDFIRFILSLIITAVPMLLILLQPDMGTAMVYLPIFIVMAFIAGIKKRYLFFILSVGALVILFFFIPAWDIFIVTERSIKFTRILIDRKNLLLITAALIIIFLLSGAGLLLIKKRYFYWIGYSALILIAAFSMTIGTNNLLKDYQIKRLVIFMDPQVDPQGAGWNVIQSITAVGSGGTFGKGYLKGTQSHYQYLPQQSTDFIFSIIAEEWGFIGSTIVFMLFLIIMLRGLFVLLSAKDAFALYIGSGIIGMIFFHFIVNTGMAMGIMPITGIPLLLVSYGGSSVLTAMIGLGLISSIYLHKYKY